MTQKENENFADNRAHNIFRLLNIFPLFLSPEV